MKILTIIAFLLFTMNCYSQITAIAIKENKKEKPMGVLRQCIFVFLKWIIIVNPRLI